MEGIGKGEKTRLWMLKATAMVSSLPSERSLWLQGTHRERAAFPACMNNGINTIVIMDAGVGLKSRVWEGSRAAVPNLFGIRDWFWGRQFFHGWWGVGGIVQAVMRMMGSGR